MWLTWQLWANLYKGNMAWAMIAVDSQLLFIVAFFEFLVFTQTIISGRQTDPEGFRTSVSLSWLAMETVTKSNISAFLRAYYLMFIAAFPKKEYKHSNKDH